MSISYPVSLPSSPAPRSIRFKSKSTVGMQRSPFSGVQTTYVHAGEWFEAEVSMPPMIRADAEAWIGFLLSLNGQQGTFLMGDPVGATPRGTWVSGSPDAKIAAAYAAGVKTITLRDMLVGATGKAGDWIQLGTGVDSHLHKLTQDYTASGSTVTLEIWPRTRAALSAGDAFVVNSALGAWRLASNESEWSIEEAQIYGITFSAVEAI